MEACRSTCTHDLHAHRPCKGSSSRGQHVLQVAARSELHVERNAAACAAAVTAPARAWRRGRTDGADGRSTSEAAICERLGRFPSNKVQPSHFRACACDGADGGVGRPSHSCELKLGNIGYRRVVQKTQKYTLRPRAFTASRIACLPVSVALLPAR